MAALRTTALAAADRPFTDSEVRFLRYIRQWGKKVVFLVNKTDILSGAGEVWAACPPPPSSPALLPAGPALCRCQIRVLWAECPLMRLASQEVITIPLHDVVMVYQLAVGVLAAAVFEFATAMHAWRLARDAVRVGLHTQGELADCCNHKRA